MLFSVIVPVYNVELYLSQCIESILNQSYHDFELILVDDGSLDKSASICDDYKKQDGRIIVIHKNNGGVTSARKAATEIMSGQYAVLVDGDDYIHTDYLKHFADIISRYAPEIICCGFRVQTATGDFIDNQPIDDEGLYCKNDIVKKLFAHLIEDQNAVHFENGVCAKAIKKEIIQHVQKTIDERIKIGEDCLCGSCCIYICNSLYISKECNYMYRFNPTSAIRSKKIRSWDEAGYIYETYKKNIGLEHAVLAKQINRNIAHQLFNISISRFNVEETFRSIKKDIKDNLSRAKYKEIIKDSDYKSLKGRLMLYALKHNQVFLMKLYSMFKG